MAHYNFKTLNRNMKFQINKLFILAILGIWLISCGLIQKKSASSEGQSLPEMALVASDGSKVQLSSLKGKKVFVNLWATWCPPCVAEMPSIQKLYNQTNREQSEFVLISFDKNFETAKEWVKRKQLDIPVYAVSGELPPLFEVGGIPTTFIFDENGNLVFQQTGSDDYSKQKFVQMLSSTP
jgi:thiol-disulfide isomerase/thioredoxin